MGNVVFRDFFLKLEIPEMAVVGIPGDGLRFSLWTSSKRSTLRREWKRWPTASGTFQTRRLCSTFLSGARLALLPRGTTWGLDVVRNALRGPRDRARGAVLLREGESPTRSRGACGGQAGLRPPPRYHLRGWPARDGQEWGDVRPHE